MDNEETHYYEFFMPRELFGYEVDHFKKRRVVIVMPADLALQSWSLFVVCHYIFIPDLNFIISNSYLNSYDSLSAFLQ